ncbi:hypothetical protein PHYSODRAFT_246676 [Phytophthora sojae]|uniref:Uncharacterized protein n=1 Tax=Phytophthora sojae (strain P6497) TaxID=1094619 RepID=G5ADS8_PHYSP|nr:hypothetical protein PHYSODRAFT_246676 [Phytophthora sojae]EGZ06331.1 hypothetical protein PHYSODRAFT_246676 [Phytophthora sojae]|eukprot:XP_009538228.1 hypothetical protein PHYSODRAFT_246676 [Phytophthora sojae]
MALPAPTADAHQIVLLPEPQWTTNDKVTKYNPLAFLENQGFKTQEDFAAWRKENGYQTLRDFMDKAKYDVTSGADFSCGFTDPKGTPQPIPEGNKMRSTGYTHDGLVHASLVLDGMKNSYSWKVYKACIPLSGSGGTSQESTRTPNAPSNSSATTAPNTFGFGSPATQNPTSSTEKPKDEKPKDDNN